MEITPVTPHDRELDPKLEGKSGRILFTDFEWEVLKDRFQTNDPTDEILKLFKRAILEDY